MQRRFSPNDARQAGRHLMARVVRWKMIFCEQQYHSGRRSAEIARDSLPLTSNSYKCHCFLHIGHLGNYNSFICHSLKPELRPAKVRQYVTVKVHNKDDAESCSSEVASSASQRKERNQLRALECYFSKLNPEKDQKPYSLHQKNKQQNDSLSTNKAEANMAHDDDNLSNRSGTLAVHFKKRNTGTKNYLNTAVEDYKGYLIFDEKNFLEMQKEDQTSSFCLTNLLAAINIAVLLFEIASPVKNSDIENLSLPLMYGAKINTLILSGEWWRLLTPMCLHSGFLHIALGCWMLLTFGPRVRRAYGQMTFLLIYILGGVSGNLTSFVHTPELTVCGTGPVFALIGAWLVYQSQNKQVIDKEVSESIFRQAVIAAALSFLLSTFGRIDNWTHLGATISGLFFGYLTCPSVELDNAAKNGQKEAVALVRRQADACKSVAIFAISILALALFAFAYGMQVQILDIE